MTPLSILRRAPNLLVRTSILFVFPLFLAACAGDSNLRRVSEPVTSMSLGTPGEVAAPSLARAMLRAGFTREEILDLGPGIRRSIAESGGAQARRQGEVVALFSYKEGKLYVTSTNSGTFILDA